MRLLAGTVIPKLFRGVPPERRSCGDLYGRPNRTKALGEGAWGDTRMVGRGNTMMSDGLVARMVWIGCEDGCDRLRDCHVPILMVD